MSGIVPFNVHGDEVRVIVINGEPQWVVADARAVLDIGNPRRVARRLHRADVSSADVRSDGQNRDRQWELIERCDAGVKTGGRPEWHSRRVIRDILEHLSERVRCSCSWDELRLDHQVAFLE